ncbi:lanthionine synthetase C family protein [uncultured Tenacibaculum sp.]|uniref:lanthionine synthetase C family protein n=1 Tax=uncultured Tenacibaculum sp. TaxID=174713 RepID=UPI002635AA26|nr:lanthionine synthetase C family protein [uncultured Tenacibaculum sp.]
MIDQIKESVFKINEELKNNTKSNYNLYSTNGGQLLFQYLTAKLKVKNSSEFENSLTDFLKNFDKTDNVSFSSGVSGNLWLINYFIEEGIIDDLLLDIKEQVKSVLQYVDEFNKQGNYDFLHGSLGLLFVSNYSRKLLGDNFVKTRIDSVLEGLQTSEKGFYFNNWMGVYKNIDITKSINFSLSHGLASAVIVLSKNKEGKEAVKGILKYIKTYKSKNKDTLSLYPSVVEKGKKIEYNSRLAWCYGDLGIAIAFWQAGKLLSNELWKKEAIEIMIHASTRTDLKKNKIVDAGFCHGTSGIAHIFNRFYKETKLEIFNKARKYWLEQTFIILKENKVENFKSWQGDNGWVKDNGLLEGVSGVGLVLLGFLTNEISDLNWDKCVLLN